MIKRALSIIFFFFIMSSVSLANKTSVALSGPEAVPAGTEVTITVSVTHRGNSAIHFTNRVWVKAGDKEIARWEFSASDRPESADFTRTVKITVVAPVEITAQGNCNLHGSDGPAVLAIGLK